MSIFKLSEKLKKKSIQPAKRAQNQAAKRPAQPKEPADLERLAMEAMADLSAKFPAWASGDVQKMKQLLGEARGVFKQARTNIIRQDIYPKTHDLKGQGATFGYPLITDIGSHMCRLILSKTNYTADDLVVLKNDLQMMETVLWKKLKGDGGSKGAEILRKLK